MGKIVTFGEIMLRLSPPDHEVLLQSPRFIAHLGGAEANAAVSLANYGEAAAFVTALPPGELGDAAIRELRKFGVETRHILRQGERLGIYFTQRGSCSRPSKVLYDRAGSAVACAAARDYPWKAILQGVDWFHVTGITPALSQQAAEATLEALEVCGRRGITVSCDLNYRKKLWKWGKAATEVMPQVVRNADVLVANEEDCQMALGIQSNANVASGKLDPACYRGLAARVLEAYPRLRYLAVSLRESHSADHNGWSGVLAGRDGFFVSRKYALTHIVDRIGGGDSFGAGLIHGLRTLNSPQEALEFAVAASALKHTIPGDFNYARREDVLALMAGDSNGRVQR